MRGGDALGGKIRTRAKNRNTCTSIANYNQYQPISIVWECIVRIGGFGFQELVELRGEGLHFGQAQGAGPGFIDEVEDVPVPRERPRRVPPEDASSGGSRGQLLCWQHPTSNDQDSKNRMRRAIRTSYKSSIHRGIAGKLIVP